MPAQPADFQADADSDTRIQLSWLLPPQERIIKYELVYWAAEDAGQQVSAQRGQGRQGSAWPLAICGGLFSISVVVWAQPLEALGPTWPVWFCSLCHPCARDKGPRSVLGLVGSGSRGSSRALRFPGATCPWCSHGHVVGEMPLRGPGGHVAGSRPCSHGGSPGISFSPCWG